jgi:hypothetical protein
MTLQQYDKLIQELQLVKSDLKKLSEITQVLSNAVLELNEKTLFVSDVENTVKQLQLDVLLLKDEKEA